MDNRLYVAYGSNLNVEQMKYRCPTAKVYGKGMLQGYRLLFKGSLGNAYLTIEQKIGEEVPVIIWGIGPKDELSLDRYEGYPSFYYKENLEVELETGEAVEAMVYIMTSLRTRLSLPSKAYYEAVKEGYESFGFDIKFIEEALKLSKGSGFHG
ncbi:gamma-glutamylcyclotransferase family protein [Tissierella sp.]|uniref:gamma-glutamylcyclotransferase family protein n=1 Tax=Tissierella sp. TaxID=41274 RepID=UPI0030D81BD1